MKGCGRLRGDRGSALFSLLILPSTAQALPDGSFWGKVAGAGPARAADRADRDDIAALLERVEAEETSGRFDAACALLERALPRYAGAERSAAWFRLGVVRSKLGRYREAAVAYAAVVADGAADSAVYSNYAEVLMAAGRLPDAEARYRDAISAASDLGVGDRRERTHELAMAYYGLAVALDRDEQPVAAREAMQRALAHDPTAAVLRLASTSGGDLFFIPDGDVFYYVGLAAEAEGRGWRRRGRVPGVHRARAAQPLGARGRGPPRQEGRGRGQAAGARRRRSDPARGRARHRAGDGRHPRAAHRRRVARPASDSRRLPGRRPPDDARDVAHRDRDGRRRARKPDARHRQGARAVRRTVRALRGIGDQAAAAVLRGGAGTADDGAHRDGRRGAVTPNEGAIAL